MTSLASIYANGIWLGEALPSADSGALQLLHEVDVHAVEQGFKPGVDAPQTVDHGSGPVSVLTPTLQRPVGWRRRSNIAQVRDLVG